MEPNHNPTALTTVRAPKTSELIAAQLRNQIVRGELREGESLPPEPVMLAQLGVSRPTLREAFRILESEALIVVRRGLRGGAKVKAPGGDVAANYMGLVLQYRGTHLSDLYEARRVIEISAVEMLMRNRRPTVMAAIGELENNLERMKAVEDNPTELIRVQEEFHVTLTRAAGNSTLAIVAEMLYYVIDKHQEMYLAKYGGASELRESVREAGKLHEQFVELLKSRSFDKAIVLWDEHICFAASLIQQASDAETVLELLS